MIFMIRSVSVSVLLFLEVNQPFMLLLPIDNSEKDDCLYIVKMNIRKSDGGVKTKQGRNERRWRTLKAELQEKRSAVDKRR